MVQTVFPIVISKKTQQERLLKVKAFVLSLFLHILVLASVMKFATQHFNAPVQELKKEEKATLISLSSYKTVRQEPKEVKKEVIKKPSKVVKPKKTVKPKKVLKKRVQKVVKTKKVQQATKIEKKQIAPVEEKTLQETQQKEPLVASPEAFTPQIPHTEQKVKETKKKLALQNSPLSDSKNSQLTLIRSLIQNALRYPAIAKRLHLEGVVTVSFSLSTTGKVSNLQLIQSSNSSVLDKRALQTVSSLDGEFPHLDKKVDLKIPIAFSLQHS